MYNGYVNVYKESGYTSHDVVARLRGIFGQKKVGHTGTLDPMAEGVLIVLLGQATRLSDIIVSTGKQYIATVRLGIVTDTDDITGKVISEVSEVNVSEEEIKRVLESFVGKQMQIPPMYSAIKVKGKKLYEYARAGIEVEREPRPVEIYSLELLNAELGKKEFSFKVSCSKGTYIRALIRDMGEKLGTGAVMSGLLRDEVGGLRAEDAYRISDFQRLKEDNRLMDAVCQVDTILSDVPSVRVRSESRVLLDNGNRLRPTDIESAKGSEDELRSAGFIRVYADGVLRALYCYDNDKKDYKVFKML